MAITSAVCTSFKLGLLKGQFTTGTTYHIALYTSGATLGAATTGYSATNETTGTGYTAGGKALSGLAALSSGNVAFLDFSDVSWSTASFTARGALIYTTVGAGYRSVATYNFGATYTATNSTFKVTFPVPGSTSAIVRIGT